jgi:hypothetical protein
MVVLASLGLAMHPDTTFIGRIEKGFDWLGGLTPGRAGFAPAGQQTKFHGGMTASNPN